VEEEEEEEEDAEQEEEEEKKKKIFNVVRVFVLNNPPASYTVARMPGLLSSISPSMGGAQSIGPGG